jgi:hypothetical protein
MRGEPNIPFASISIWFYKEILTNEGRVPHFLVTYQQALLEITLDEPPSILVGSVLPLVNQAVRDVWAVILILRNTYGGLRTVDITPHLTELFHGNFCFPEDVTGQYRVRIMAGARVIRHYIYQQLISAVLPPCLRVEE